MKPKTSQSKLSPIERKTKELNVLFNNAWSNVSLGHIKSWGDLFKYLGVTDPEKYGIEDCPFAPQLKEKPDYETWARIKTQLLSEALAALAPTPASSPVEPEVDKNFWTISKDNLDTLYQPLVNDALAISGTLYKAYKKQHLTIHDLVKPYLPSENPNQSAECFYFQLQAAEQMFYNIVHNKHRAQLLLGKTGEGKTYAYMQLIRWMLDSNYAEGKSLAPYPYMVITKASVVEQTKRVARDKFGIKVGDELLVSNYEQLRADLGEMFIEETEIVEDGVVRKIYKWKKGVFPVGMVDDESQVLKNQDSQQTQLCLKYSAITGYGSEYTWQIFSSATPFSKVASAMCFCVASKIPYQTGIGKIPLSELTWPSFAKKIAAPADPLEYDKPAMRRLLKVMNPYIVGFKNVRPKFKPHNRQEIISFESPELAKAYTLAWEEYLREKQKIEGSNCKNMQFLILVQFLKFRQAAELLKAGEFTRRMWRYVQEGKAVIFGGNFKPTIARIVLNLYNDYNISRDQISIIWGGSAELSGGAQKLYSKEEMLDIFKRSMLGEDIPKRIISAITKQLQAQAAGLVDIPRELELGVQNPKQRQKEIDKFQTGTSHYCLFTFGAGGAGLSLHHEFPYTRQREGLFSVTWNEMEMNQAFGRGPRHTSLSDTYQTVLAYAGTIETHVLDRVNGKTGSLTEVIKHGAIEHPIDIDATVVDATLRLAGANTENDEDDDLGHEIFEEELDKPETDNNNETESE